MINQKFDKVKMYKIMIPIFVLCAVGYIFVMYMVNQRVETVDVSGCEIATEGRIEYKIDKILCKYDYVDISGYAYEPGISVDVADTAVLAYDPVADVYYKLPTENVKKTKITEKADDGYNYDYAQFHSVTLRKKIPEGCRLCIWYRCNDENILIPTEEIIFY